MREMKRVLCARFANVTITPFGSDVLPDVNCKNATSSSRRDSSSKLFAKPPSTAPALPNQLEKPPAELELPPSTPETPEDLATL